MLIETLGCLYYFELSEDEALDLALKNNKGIVKIVLDDEYKDTNYEKN